MSSSGCGTCSAQNATLGTCRIGTEGDASHLLTCRNSTSSACVFDFPEIAVAPGVRVTVEEACSTLVLRAGSLLVGENSTVDASTLQIDATNVTLAHGAVLTTAARGAAGGASEGFAGSGAGSGARGDCEGAAFVYDAGVMGGNGSAYHSVDPLGGLEHEGTCAVATGSSDGHRAGGCIALVARGALRAAGRALLDSSGESCAGPSCGGGGGGSVALRAGAISAAGALALRADGGSGGLGGGGGRVAVESGAAPPPEGLSASASGGNATGGSLCRRGGSGTILLRSGSPPRAALALSAAGAGDARPPRRRGTTARWSRSASLCFLSTSPAARRSSPPPSPRRAPWPSAPAPPSWRRPAARP